MKAASVSVVLAVLATAALVVGAAWVWTAAWPAAGISINGDGTGRAFDGVGAVLGGGGNARYLMDYPEPQRSQIFDYLFTPGVGASLQLLKLEIGGDANSSDGAEPSIEHARGRVNCQAGYEFAIAAQAMARNPALRLYGLQWTAPGWVGDRRGSLFTADDIRYLLDWLGCAGRYGLRISYLGGWNESDRGDNAAWFHSLRQALDAHGYRQTRIVAGDTGWQYADSPDVAILGAHNTCGFPTGVEGGSTICSVSEAALASGKPLWGSEMGGMDAGTHAGCHRPCASAFARALVRGYLDARMTGYLEWPVLDAMPARLPFENRGLVTADQPWSGNYTVNAMAWVIAHLSQFARPADADGRGGWSYVDSSGGYLENNRANGSYVTLVSAARDEFSTIIETTAATSARRVTVRVSGGQRLPGRTIHVWASDFGGGGGEAGGWFTRRSDIHPVNGTFSLVVQPGSVYTLTTTVPGGAARPAGVPASASLSLPHREDLGTSGAAGAADDEPGLLAAQDGAFEVGRCGRPDGTATTCTVQQAEPVPVLWHAGDGGARYPFAILGDGGWANYTVRVDVLLTQARTSAGVIGRFERHGSQADIGHFGGYLFDLSTTGGWRLIRNAPSAAGTAVLASGTLPRAAGVNHWHQLALSLFDSTISASVDGVPVASVGDATWTTGLAGIEAGAFTATWPHAEYSGLSIIP